MNINYFINRFQKKLIQQDQLSLIRKRKSVSSKTKNCYTINKNTANSFCSNDYLGLSQNSDLIKVFKKTVNQFGIGSTASQYIIGYTDLHQEFETSFSKFMNCDRALLFGSGYLANLGVISALTEKNDMILMDKYNHASLIDAAKLSNASFKRYIHNDLEGLRNMLEVINSPKVIVSDGVFSMTGEIANIPELSTIANHSESLLIIDDTHGVGIFGKKGAGTCSNFSLTQNEVHLITTSLGKAFGSYGAMVCGSQIIIEYLEQFARTGIYSTAIPSVLVAAGIKALEILENETWRREKLHYLISFFDAVAKELDLNILNSISPIKIIPIGDNQKVIAISESLLEAGFLVAAIRPPTVPLKQACLRITLTCLHTEKQIKNLLLWIKKLLS
ncbi:MAG: aminotransferase class I/II-fold pyridoxal phosphate-dependent enzyme [Gammaproteobacteria bacterium]